MALGVALPDTTPTQLQIGNATISVEVVATEATREQGLSGRASLPPNSGMWFVFDQEDVWGIWMKGMRFPLDIVYVDNGKNIATVYKNVSPDTYPEIFYPTKPARYVLELPAGFADAHGIAEGNKVVVQ